MSPGLTPVMGIETTVTMGRRGIMGATGIGVPRATATLSCRGIPVRSRPSTIGRGSANRATTGRILASSRVTGNRCGGRTPIAVTAVIHLGTAVEAGQVGAGAKVAFFAGGFDVKDSPIALTVR